MIKQVLMVRIKMNPYNDDEIIKKFGSIETDMALVAKFDLSFARVLDYN